MKTAALVVVAFLSAASSIEAQAFTEINIGSQVNANLQLYANGANYQPGGTQLNVAGVPFGLAQAGTNANSTGIVQSPVGAASSAPPNNTGPFDFAFSVPAGTRATVLYALMNTAYGVYGMNEGSVVVTGTHGETATLQLIEGVNIRDHNNDDSVNSLSDPTVVPTCFLNGAPTTESVQSRLDCQKLVLPATFTGDTIAAIAFKGEANGTGGQAFLAGLTLGDTPKPTETPYALAAAALLLALWWWR
jgi:hypothetical protein